MKPVNYWARPAAEKFENKEMDSMFLKEVIRITQMIYE